MDHISPSHSVQTEKNINQLGHVIIPSHLELKIKKFKSKIIMFEVKWKMSAATNKHATKRASWHISKGTSSKSQSQDVHQSTSQT